MGPYSRGSLNCHPDRSGPTFSSAPNCGASGRVVEGSWHDFNSTPPAVSTLRHSERSPRSEESLRRFSLLRELCVLCVIFFLTFSVLSVFRSL